MSKMPEFSQANQTAMLAVIDGMMEEQGFGEFWRTYTKAERVDIAEHTLLYAWTAVKFQQRWHDAQQPQTERTEG